ncbi:MAG: GntR family transcriptional regulator [Paludibacteraceae bacterium]|nr:GntR family transcriptional regulator [Paludibacteraceae bacterium]
MEFRETQAIYLQIGDYMCEQILLGRWKPNDRIPSVRELGVDLQVNPNTVMRTYDFLQNLDIIYNKRGVGYFVSVDALLRIVTYRRSQFVGYDLPQFFKSITLLDMSMEEISELYKEFLKNEKI